MFFLSLMFSFCPKYRWKKKKVLDFFSLNQLQAPVANWETAGADNYLTAWKGRRGHFFGTTAPDKRW